MSTPGGAGGRLIAPGVRLNRGCDQDRRFDSLWLAGRRWEPIGGPIDAYDVGTEIGQQHPGEGHRTDSRHLDQPDSRTADRAFLSPKNQS